MDRMTIEAIYRYPVKGLSPEPLRAVALTPGEPLPQDRRYAVENGPSGFDPEHPVHLPKIRFLMLMRDEALARLVTRFDETTTTLTVSEGGVRRVAADLSRREGRAELEAFLSQYCAADLRGAPRVLEAPGFSFSDTRHKVVSIINLASVRALEERVGVPVDPLRFRGNVHVGGLPPWGEFDLVDREFGLPGGVRLRGLKRIERCAATNVDPVSGLRDLQIPRTLLQAYGHTDCGLYATVIEGGEVSVGDSWQTV